MSCFTGIMASQQSIDVGGSAGDSRLPRLGAEGDGDGAVVVQAHGHVGAEAAAPGGDAALGELVGEAPAEDAGGVGWGGADEAGAAAAAGVCVEGELRDDEGGAADV